MAGATELLQLFETVDRSADTKRADRPVLVDLARKAHLAGNAVERARLLVQLSSVADASLEAAIAEARHTGIPWRQLAARLDVPYQTLHRRYRSSDR